MKVKEEPVSSDEETDGSRKRKSKSDGVIDQPRKHPRLVGNPSSILKPNERVVTAVRSHSVVTTTHGSIVRPGRTELVPSTQPPVTGKVSATAAVNLDQSPAVNQQSGSMVTVYDSKPMCLFCLFRHDINDDCIKIKAPEASKCPFCNSKHGINQRCDEMVKYLSQFSPLNNGSTSNVKQQSVLHSNTLGVKKPVGTDLPLHKQEVASTSEHLQAASSSGSTEFSQSLSKPPSELLQSSSPINLIRSQVCVQQGSASQALPVFSNKLPGPSTSSDARNGVNLEENLDDVTIVSESHYRSVHKSFVDEMNKDKGSITPDIDNIAEGSKWDSSVVYDDPESDKELGDIRCPFCYEKHSRPYVCLQTMVYLATFGKFEPIKIMDGLRTRFMCPTCYSDFPWDYNCRAHTFSKHVKTLQNSDVSISVKLGPVPLKVDEGKFACPRCKSIFHSHQGCRSHLKVCDGSSCGRKKSTMTPYKSDKPRYRCPFCPEVHTRPYNCRYHVQKQHTRCEKPAAPNEPVKLAHERYLCPFCSAVFSRVSTCKKHIAKNHMSEDVVVCSACTRTYHVHEGHACLALPIREKTGHYRCPYCPSKVFTRGYNCTAHIKEKHSDAETVLHSPKEKQAQPSLSPVEIALMQKFVNKDESRLEPAAIIGHQSTATLKESAEKESECMSCGVTCRLQNHKCLQTKCPHCTKFFAPRSELLKHILSDHKLNFVDDEEGKDDHEGGSLKMEMEELMAAADYYGECDAEEAAGKNRDDAGPPGEEVIIEDPEGEQRLPVIESVYSQSESGSKDGSCYQDGSLGDDEDDDYHGNSKDNESTGEGDFLDDLNSSSSPPTSPNASVFLPSVDFISQLDSLSKSVDLDKIATTVELTQLTKTIKGQEPLIQKVGKELQEIADILKESEQHDDLPSFETNKLKDEIGKVVIEAVMAAEELMAMYRAKREKDGIDMENKATEMEKKSTESEKIASKKEICLPTGRLVKEKSKADGSMLNVGSSKSPVNLSPAFELRLKDLLNLPVAQGIGQKNPVNLSRARGSGQKNLHARETVDEIQLSSNQDGVDTHSSSPQKENAVVDTFSQVSHLKVSHEDTCQASTSSRHGNASQCQDGEFESEFYKGFVAQSALTALRHDYPNSTVSPKKKYGKTTSVDFKGGVMMLTMEDEDSRHKVRVDKMDGSMRAKVWRPDSYEDDEQPNLSEVSCACSWIKAIINNHWILRTSLPSSLHNKAPILAKKYRVYF